MSTLHGECERECAPNPSSTYRKVSAPKAIQERLSSIMVTMDIYEHLMPEIDEGPADMLDADMKGARQTTIGVQAEPLIGVHGFG